MQLSIIIPLYNIHSYKDKLLKNIRKIYDQRYEYIFVDDGSIDKSLNFLKKNLKLKNMYFYQLKNNSGPGIARNIGIKKAKGKYILFLDADDDIISKNLLKILNCIKQKNFDLYYYNFYKKNFTLSKLCLFNNIKSKFALNLFLKKELDMSVNFCLFRKSFLIKKKIRFNKGVYEDIFFMIKCLYNARNISGKDLKVYIKNNTANSITNTFKKFNIECFIKSCNQKYKLLNDNRIYSQNLQYGLRGDYVTVIKMIKKSKSTMSEKLINKIFRKIIDPNFIIKTKYDKIVQTNLYK
tara:strand:- start:355 stop:1239 length:885 start_codon:yes stop_codon:yes gene_type:complete